MCAVSASGCRSVVEAKVHAKLMRSSQAVGLLAILADSGKQELFRHVSYTQSCSGVYSLPSDSAQLGAKIVQSPQTSARPYTEKKMEQGILKKVRFAPDVVEPSGDSREYRCRKNVIKTGSTNAYSKRQEHCELSQNVKITDAANTPTVESTYVKLPQPRMPPNRMLLYKGMQCYRSKMMPFL